jgi:hypothetical protein
MYRNISKYSSWDIKAVIEFKMATMNKNTHAR